MCNMLLHTISVNQLRLFITEQAAAASLLRQVHLHKTTGHTARLTFSSIFSAAFSVTAVLSLQRRILRLIYSIFYRRYADNGESDHCLGAYIDDIIYG